MGVAKLCKTHKVKRMFKLHQITRLRSRRKLHQQRSSSLLRLTRVWGSASVSAASTSRPSSSRPSASGPSASRPSVSGASTIKEGVRALNMDDDPLVDVAIGDDDDHGNSRAYKIHDEV
nr:hypothetical protein [Tanacetum cinerariifolium]